MIHVWNTPQKILILTFSITINKNYTGSGLTAFPQFWILAHIAWSFDLNVPWWEELIFFPNRDDFCINSNSFLSENWVKNNRLECWTGLIMVCVCWFKSSFLALTWIYNYISACGRKTLKLLSGLNRLLCGWLGCGDAWPSISWTSDRKYSTTGWVNPGMVRLGQLDTKWKQTKSIQS